MPFQEAGRSLEPGSILGEWAAWAGPGVDLRPQETPATCGREARGQGAAKPSSGQETPLCVVGSWSGRPPGPEET